MKQALLLLNIAVLGTTLAQAQTTSESLYLDPLRTPNEQNLKLGRNAAWALPLVATQYHSQHPLPVMKEATEAQDDARYLDAIILLDDAIKSGRGSAEERAEINLLRASFLLQGGQFEEVREILAPLLSHPRHSASAHALTAMSHLQQGRMQEALQTAQQARGKEGGVLPPLVLSYALQGEGRLAEAHDAVREYNSHSPDAVTLAREAELDLTLDQVQPARKLLRQAREKNGAHPYVAAVSGLAYLIDGQAGKAKAGFEAALKRDPKDPKMLLGLGLAEIKLGNLQAGLKNFQVANEADPNNALTLTYLGRAELQAGQEEKARASWRNAQQADRNDPAPWLYQAQAELQANQLQQAQASVREAQARTASRAVYRGERLLKEDEQLLQANLAEIQRRQGLGDMAFHTLADSAGEKSSATLRNMADLLEGRRFGESARRSLLLQSLFNQHPGSLPATLDIYGDGAGQTGASTPQHGVVSELTAQRATYHNYDELFGGHAHLEADAITGNQNTNGEQLRFGVGNDLVGISMAQRRYKTDGHARFEGLDNSVEQAVVQWRPLHSTQAFVSYQNFDSQHGETFYQTVPWGSYDMIKDRSWVTRLGAHHDLAGNSEIRALWSRQRTDQGNDYEFIFMPSTFSASGSSEAHSAEVQYQHSGASHALQLGVQQYRGRTIYSTGTDYSRNARQVYAAWQQALNPMVQLDAQLAWGHTENVDNLKTFGDTSVYLRRWLPRLGMVFTPDNATHVRLAAWQGMGINAAGDAALAPASLAGAVLNRYGDDGKLVRAASLDFDRQLGSNWLLAAGAQQHHTKDPYIDSAVSAIQQYYKQRITESSLALHWQPEGKPWAVKLAFDHERILNHQDPTSILPDAVNEQSLYSSQAELRWFAGKGSTATLKWSHNRTSGTQKGYDSLFNPILLPHRERFQQVDANLGWQFAKPGVLTVGVRNATDKQFQYQDIDRLNPRFSKGRLAYAKIKFTW